MVLNLGNSLFGDNNPLAKLTELTQQESFPSNLIINEGGAGRVILNLIPAGLGVKRRDVGFQTTYSILNYTGAPRTISITITNATKGTTLFSSGYYVIGGSEAVHDSFFYSLEKISSGDVITLDVAGDGIGTGVGAPAFGNVYFELNQYFITEDESN